MLPAIFPLSAGIQRKLSMTFKIRATVERLQRNIFFKIMSTSLVFHYIQFSIVSWKSPLIVPVYKTAVFYKLAVAVLL